MFSMKKNPCVYIRGTKRVRGEHDSEVSEREGRPTDIFIYS